MTRICVKDGKKPIKSASMAMRFCVTECPLWGNLGCALTCELRKRFQIPPHGPKYPDSESFKLTEPIKSNVKLRLWKEPRK